MIGVCSYTCITHFVPPFSCDDDTDPCTHKKSHFRIFLHVTHAENHGHRKITIQSVDTDAVIITIAFGMGKHYRLMPIYEIACALGREKKGSLVIPSQSNRL